MSKTIYHNHHITPKCLLKHKSKKFIDHQSNIIQVSLKHHIALHKWFFMLTGDRGCESAYIGLKTGKFHFDSTGIKLTKEHKRKISKSLSGKFNYLYGKHKDHPRYGTKLSKYTKQKIRLTKQNKCYNSKKWSINGKIFNSSREAGIYLSVSQSTIVKWCNKNIPLCYNFIPYKN